AWTARAPARGAVAYPASGTGSALGVVDGGASSGAAGGTTGSTPPSVAGASAGASMPVSTGTSTGTGAAPRATRTPRDFIQALNSSAVMFLPFWLMLKRHGVLSNSVLGL